ncbi:hypothetical protein FPV67DRAFT_1085984 [Lyophyllum atratum]|nr:hypothetical protein FPV67DRAFT_1085984 [Lyophyllum atratum]
MAPRHTSEDDPGIADISLESDIVDLDCTTDIGLSCDHEIPSRPTSRLGFNRARIHNSFLLEEEFLEDVDSEPPFRADASGPSPLRRQVWARTADVDMDITTLVSMRDNVCETYSDAAIPSSCYPGGSSDTLDDPAVLSSDEELDAELDSDYSSCDDSDDESDTTSLFPDSVSDIIGVSLSPAHEESDWSLRPKYSCLPSPLSPRHVPPCAFEYHHTPPRHRYRHHGHSRHALHHLRWFWATREDKWVEHKARMREAKAYDGLSIFSSVSPGLRLPSECITPDVADTPRAPPSPPMSLLPPLSIHPRRGDLCALRDPYCMHIDRYFVGMPMWTMAKTLWMFDVHMASGDYRRRKEAEGHEGEDDLFEEDQSENESIETSGSHAFSDDSDSTLVGSESDPDLSASVDRATGVGDAAGGEGHQKLLPDEGKGYPGSADASSSTPPSKDKLDIDLQTSPQSPSTDSKLHFPPSPRSVWATSWYRRWEVLMQLCIENNPAVVGEPDVRPTVPPVKSQRFFIADDWSREEDDPDNEEDVEVAVGNVLVVVNDDNSDGRPLRRFRF